MIAELLGDHERITKLQKPFIEEGIPPHTCGSYSVTKRPVLDENQRVIGAVLKCVRCSEDLT